MIPKVIHYCWFGRGEKPKIVKKCIKSWKKFCSGYEIKEWNEDNFDIDCCSWTRQAYDAKKYAFVADYARLAILYAHGGLYFDTDQEVVSSFDGFLENEAFLGYCNGTDIGMGVIGTEPRSEFIGELLHYYDGRDFVVDGKIDALPNTDIVTDILKNRGFRRDNTFQMLGKVAIYPQTYFSPLDVLDAKKDCFGKNTAAVHHWAMTWRTEKGKKDIKRVRRHSEKWYKIYEQVAAYPKEAFCRLFKGSKRKDRE